MDSMNIEQAVFASSDRGSVKGYQLVGKSSGIDRSCGRQLCLWAPSQMLSADPLQWTINYFPVSDDHVAVTRTVLGGPEYSGRGGTQVVTLILLLDNDQFLCYRCDPIAVASTAMAMGALRLPLDLTCQQLDQVSLPGRPFVDHTDHVDDDCDEQLLEELTGLVNEARRAAVIGLNDPVAVAGQLIPRLSVQTRRDFSFTTGLAPAVRRPYRTHFLPAVDSAMQRTLDSQGIVCIDVG